MTPPAPADLTVVIPTYNESDRLGELVTKLFEATSASGVSLELVVVDDNSPDGTGKLADDLAAQNPRVHVLHRPGKQGLGRAYCAGFK